MANKYHDQNKHTKKEVLQWSLADIDEPAMHGGEKSSHGGKNLTYYYILVYINNNNNNTTRKYYHERIVYYSSFYALFRNYLTNKVVI